MSRAEQNREALELTNQLGRLVMGRPGHDFFPGPNAIFAKHAEDAAKCALAHHAYMSLDKKCKPLLATFKKMDPEIREATMTATCESSYLLSMIRPMVSADQITRSTWYGTVDHLKVLARDKPELIADALTAILTCTESPIGHPSRHTVMGMKDVQGKRIVDYDLSMCSPELQTSVSLYLDFAALPACKDAEPKAHSYVLAKTLCMLLQTLYAQQVGATKAAAKDNPNCPCGGSRGPDGMDCPCGSYGRKMCARCHVQRYCSAECQKDHWPEHKLECKKLAEEYSKNKSSN